MTKNKTDTDELEKWAKIHNEAVTITGFMQWVDDTYGDKEYWQRPRLEQLIYEYFEIDYEKLENQRRMLLESIQ